MWYDELPAPPGLVVDMLVVSVSFFDTRATQRTIDAFGLRCKVMPPSCCRLVHLGGGVQLDESTIGKVFSMRKADGDDDSFVVEFFDVRDAWQVQQQFGMSPEAGSGSKNVASETQTVVLIRGLPNAVCTAPMMQAVLQQAGLESDVVNSQPKAGKPCGEVLLTLSGGDAAKRCVQHFQGRTWDPSGAKVTVTVKGTSQQHTSGRNPKARSVSQRNLFAREVLTAKVVPKGLHTVTDAESTVESATSDGELTASSQHFDSASKGQLVWPSNKRSSAVTASTCSSEHSDADIEELMA
jgi:hypothetical protein